MPERGGAAGARAPERGGAELLVILDGASEPPRDGRATSLERAATPALDRLCAEGSLTRLRTVAPWLKAGSEHAIPALLGWTPPAPVDRGAVEAAARGIAVDDGARAWRIDVRAAVDGGRADAAAALPALAPLMPFHRLHPLGGHRLLAVGRGPLPPFVTGASADGASGMGALAAGASGLGASATGASGLALDGVTLHPWPEGLTPPRLLDERTLMIAAPGAAAGLARLLGARVVTPAGATGRPGSDLAAKAAAALAALEDGAERIVVHVGAPDEAAHELDPAAKIAAIEAADRDLIAPLAAALRPRGSGLLRVCPDHGCDPADGRHDAAPVPCVEWAASDSACIAGTTVSKTATRGSASAPRLATDAPRFATNAPRLTERAVAALPVTLPAVAGPSVRAAA